MSKKNTTTAMLAASLTGDPEATARVVAHQAETRFVRTLIDMRIEKKLSQRDLAKKMGVGPSKVCRLEACADKDLNLGDVMLYTKALGVNMSVLFDDPALPAADRIKHHVFAVHDLLEQLMKLAHQVSGDDSICAKIKQFYGEVLFNFMRGVGNGYAKSPGAIPIRLDGSDTPVTGSAHDKNASKQLSAAKQRPAQRHSVGTVPESSSTAGSASTFSANG
jgi:transcriptional regulator with XRE-family HTH domain